MSTAMAALVPLGCAGAGHLLLRVLRVNPALGFGGELAMRFLLGSGALSFLVLAGMMVAGRYGLEAGWALCLAFALAAGADMSRQAAGIRPRLTSALQKPRLQLGLLAAFGIETALLARAVWVYGLDNDAVAIWALKARALAVTGSPAALLHDPSRLFSHPLYPLHVPIDMALVFQAAGGADLQTTKAVFAAFAVALVLLFQSLAARLRGTGTSVLYGLVLLGVPYVVAGAIPVAADFALSAYVLGGGAFLWFWLDEGGRHWLLLAALFLAVGLWTKRDAAAIWTGGAAIVGVVSLTSRRPRSILLYLLPAFPVLLWYVYAGWQGPADPDFTPLGAGWLLTHLGRLPEIAGSAAPYLFNGYFGLTWALLAIAILMPGAWSRGSRGAVLLVALHLVAVSASYVFSTWTPITLHVTMSFPRIALEMLPLSLLITLSRFGAEDLRAGLRALSLVRRVASPVRS